MTTSILSIVQHFPLASGGSGRTGLTVPETLLLFVGAPVGSFLLIAAAVLRPGAGGGTRYRPGRGWDAPDAWFGEQPSAALSPTESASGALEPGHEAAGGSSGGW